jgi:hypothetical protein
MGYRGIGVEFVDEHGDPFNARDVLVDEHDYFGDDASTAYAQHANTLASLVDEVIEADVVIGLAISRRIQRIESARAFSENAAREPRAAVGASAARPGSSVPARVEMAMRSFTAEIASALRIPERTAARMIETGRKLVNELPSTLQALSEGRLSFGHAEVLVDQSFGLEPGEITDLEAAMIPLAASLTPRQFERRARSARERRSPETMVKRQEKAEDSRYVDLTPERDGMVTLSVHLPAAQGIAIFGRMTDIARSLQAWDEPRTLTQLRVDALSDLLLDVDGQTSSTAGMGDGPTHRYRSIRARVLVTVPALTLLRCSREPGVVEGYGPIDAQTARELTANAPTMHRLLTHPESGVLLSYGRTTYRIPEQLRTWLRVRDGTCRFPGCNRSAAACDVDHTDDWNFGGATAQNNLALLCKGHHTLKHAAGWSVSQEADGSGTLTWVSPVGYTYVTHAEVKVEPVVN